MRVNNVKCFYVLSKGRDIRKFIVGNKTRMNIKGIGRTHLKIYSGAAIILPNKMYLPKCLDNIISLDVLTTQEYKFIGKNNW